ncbi:MAG: rod shape-determining protein MreC [Clostridiales bacterium]|jgi:rod shape-determining protein MreC|nr:rod shape-determining protein MreC [Clostridiales bacterium]
MKWYQEHSRLIIILIILLLLLSLTIASFINQGSNSWLGRQIETVTAFVQEPVSEAGKGISTTIKGIFQFRRLLAENNALKEEIAELKRELIDQTLLQEDLAELRDLSSALNFKNPQDDFSHITGTVIAIDASQWFRIFTVNIGSEDGVHKDAVVINADGLIGRVLEVGEDWAKVISIIDENNRVSFQVFRDLSLLGILSGDGKGGITGYMLDENASVIEGDVLITSGMELYPRGIPIGKVSRVVWDKDALLRMVEIDPAVNFNNIQKVTVIITKP